MPELRNILLVGCGKWGVQCCADGWARNRQRDVRVVEPFDAAAEALRSELSVPVVSAATDLDPGFTPDIVVFAVKPQGMDDIVPSYAGRLIADTVVLSIAAGAISVSSKSIWGGT